MKKLSTLTAEEIKASHREACRRYRLKNKAKIAESSKLYQQENRVSIAEYVGRWRKTSAGRNSTRRYRLARKQKAIALLGGKCVHCGTTERLQFDHINRDRTDKKKVVAYMVFSASWDDVLKELQKCQLLCFPCHIKKSTEEKRKLKFALNGNI